MFSMKYVGPDPKDPNFEIYTITAEPAEMEALEKQANERNMALNDYVVYLLELALKLEDMKKKELVNGNNSNGPNVLG